MLPFSTVLGFTLYEDTDDGRAATHQLYSSAIDVWYAPMDTIGVYQMYSKAIELVCSGHRVPVATRLREPLLHW